MRQVYHIQHTYYNIRTDRMKIFSCSLCFIDIMLDYDYDHDDCNICLRVNFQTLLWKEV